MGSHPHISDVTALVVCQEDADLYLAPRTVRAMGRRGVAGQIVTVGQLARELAAVGGAVWLVEAGSFLREAGEIVLPRPSVTGRALGAVGAEIAEDGQMERAWGELLARSGGHLDEHLIEACGGELKLASVYLEAPLVRRFAEVVGGVGLRAAMMEVMKGARLIHWAPFDVTCDRRLRVAQVVTSLQIGGAERLVLDLARLLPRAGTGAGVKTAVITTGRAMRKSFAAPAGHVDVSAAPGGREGRMRAAAEAAQEFAADVVHAHLLTAVDLAAFREAGIPVVVTVHNQRQGWPAGLDGISEKDAAMVAACSQAVERDLAAAGVADRVPVRTVWNGIEPNAFVATPERVAVGRALREKWGVAADDLVMVALANPRPQKRLERLPGVLKLVREELARRGDARRVFLLIAGEASETLPDSVAAKEKLESEIWRLGLENAVLMPGAMEDVAAVLAASDVMVSLSAWEGLSLAHLEAVAAGKAVVASDVGGASELAQFHANVRVVGTDASDQEAADAVARVLLEKPEPRPLHLHFHAMHMARRYALLYPRVIARQMPRQPEGLLLVANNFSTGGAQSSARRLLLELQRRGRRVRAAVIQEQPEFPTPGRRALMEAGVEVLAVRPGVDAGDAVAELLASIDADPPEAVLFWNVITRHKMLLADLLLADGVRCFDVSPGEMYFASLEKYFENPYPGLPVMMGREYGSRLGAGVVKYAAEREQMEKSLGVRVEVIPNGLATPETMPERRRTEGKLTLGTAARISPQKKFEELFDALRLARSRMPEFVFRIAGGSDGPGAESAAYVQCLKDAYQDLPLEWAGEMAGTADFLRGLDIFVMISEPAGCPNASLEAMAAGLPVVATDVGGASEQVIDGVTGRLVVAGNAESLATAIVDAASDCDRLLAWGRNGFAHVREHFSMELMAGRYERIVFEK